jgi:hypothetical protein
MSWVGCLRRGRQRGGFEAAICCSGRELEGCVVGYVDIFLAYLRVGDVSLGASKTVESRDCAEAPGNDAIYRGR